MELDVPANVAIDAGHGYAQIVVNNAVIVYGLDWKSAMTEVACFFPVVAQDVIIFAKIVVFGVMKDA